MVGMTTANVAALVALASLATAIGVYVLLRPRLAGRSGSAADADDLALVVHAALAEASSTIHEQSRRERDEAVEAALRQAALLSREQLEQVAQHQREQLEQVIRHQREQLGSKEQHIDSHLQQVQHDMQSELARLGEAVNNLGTSNAERFGAFDESLRSHAEVAAALADSTRSLREALASPQMRGQWGERMAEDVLRLAGFIENVNYRKQVQVEGGTGRPDYTFELPKGHVLYMDVKFPLAAYLRYLEAGTDAERSAHLKRFLTDVRHRVKELACRDYARESDGPSVDYVLLFLPNEQLTGFIYEHDPGLLDDAMSQRVVLCSPLTLFAFMGIIRQAFDNFMIEQTSDQILQLLGTFSQQWQKYNDALDRVRRQFDSVGRSLDDLVGVRRRALSKPLHQLDQLRLQRGLATTDELLMVDSDGDLCDGDEDDVDELGTLPGPGQAEVRRLGA
jgi:DNA recombination protein RmuC